MKNFKSHIIFSEKKELFKSIENIINNKDYTFQIKKELILLVFKSFCISFKFYLDQMEHQACILKKLNFVSNKYNQLLFLPDILSDTIYEHNFNFFKLQHEINDYLGFYISKLYENNLSIQFFEIDN